MRQFISRVELEGFKSFGRPTSMDLPSSVAVLIGRNGSGKSNLTDAVRWVFGERDLRSLRVRRPEDLFFSGTQQVPRDSGCRVALTIADLDESPSTPQTRIERRMDGRRRETLHVNGEPVEEAGLSQFMGSLGIQVPLRSVIRQGEVDRLLWLRPRERAALFASVLAPDAEEADAAEIRVATRAAARAAAAKAHLREREAGLHRRCDALAGRVAAGREAALLDERIRAQRARLVKSALGGVDVERLLRALALPVAYPAGPGDPAAELRRLLEARSNLPLVAADIEDRLAACEFELAQLHGARTVEASRLASARSRLGRLTTARRERFLELHDRIEHRFADFFATLVPGGEVSLPLEGGETGAPGPGVGLRVRLPTKREVPLRGLSGGQLATVGLALALACFAELRSPVLILDEVEPALDEIMVRRVSDLLARLARESQVIMVSHQRRTRDTARTVFQVERTPALGSHIRLYYDPRGFRAPGHRVG